MRCSTKVLNATTHSRPRSASLMVAIRANYTSVSAIEQSNHTMSNTYDVSSDLCCQLQFLMDTSRAT